MSNKEEINFITGLFKEKSSVRNMEGNVMIGER